VKSLDPRDCDLHVRPDHRTLSTVLELHFHDFCRQPKVYTLRVAWNAIEESHYEDAWGLFVTLLFRGADRIFHRGGQSVKP